MLDQHKDASGVRKYQGRDPTGSMQRGRQSSTRASPQTRGQHWVQCVFSACNAGVFRACECVQCERVTKMKGLLHHDGWLEWRAACTAAAGGVRGMQAHLGAP